MSSMFKSNGKLRIPMEGKMAIPKGKVTMDHGKLIVREAYCPNGHSLINETKIDKHRSIHFIYSSQDGKEERDILVSAVVGQCSKIILNGKPFNEGEVVKVLCPTCRVELKKLVDCKCGAPIYLFYLDTNLDNQYGQSFCSRIGCVKASHLRFSQDVIREFTQNHSF